MKSFTKITALSAAFAAALAVTPQSSSSASLEAAFSQALAIKASRFTATLVNGTPVPRGARPQVVNLSMGCTGTVVGERAVITAAHCGDTGDQVSFSVGSASYEGELEVEPSYAGSGGGPDLAIVVTAKPIRGVTPASVGGAPAVEAEITVLGYGRTEPHNDSPPPDGQLREGTSRVAEMTEIEFRIEMEGGAIGHWGDSGGPAFSGSGSDATIIGILSWGPFSYDTTYFSRTDSAAARAFLRGVAQRRGIAINGVAAAPAAQTAPAPRPSAR